MSLSNKEIVQRVMNEVFVRREPLSVMHFFSEEYKQHNPLIPNGKSAIPALVAALSAEFSYTPGRIVAEGNLVMIHGRYVGWGDKPMIGVDIFELRDGLLVEHWDVLQEEIPAELSVNGNAMF